jgi:hypothetical protein
MRPRRLLLGAVAAIGLVVLLSVAAGRATAQPTPPTSPPPATTVATGPTPTGPAGPPSSPPLGLLTPPPNSPGWWDLAGRLRLAVNGLFRDLIAAALTPTLQLVARSLLATPDLTAPGGRVRDLWENSVAIANTAYVLLVVAGGLLLMTNESLQTRYQVKDVAPRLVVGMLAGNLSLLLVGGAIQAANALSRALLGPGVTTGQVTATLEGLLLPPLDDPDLLLLLVALVVVVLGLVLVVTYLARVALLVLLIVAAPLALAGHALPQTEELAHWWWRATAACLGVQVAQALALATALRVFFHADRTSVVGLGGGRLVDLLVAVCLLWLLVRIPAWAARMVFSRPSTLVRVARSYVTYRLLRRGLRTVTR